MLASENRTKPRVKYQDPVPVPGVPVPRLRGSPGMKNIHSRWRESIGRWHY